MKTNFLTISMMFLTVIATAQAPKKGWDGTIKGKKAPDYIDSETGLYKYFTYKADFTLPCPAGSFCPELFQAGLVITKGTYQVERNPKTNTGIVVLRLAKPIKAPNQTMLKTVTVDGHGPQDQDCMQKGNTCWCSGTPTNDDDKFQYRVSPVVEEGGIVAIRVESVWKNSPPPKLGF